jgi:hypothetical protein
MHQKAPKSGAEKTIWEANDGELMISGTQPINEMER